MEFETFFGVPAHPLIVHMPVVLTPLAAIVAIALLFRSDWRKSYAWVVALLTAGALFGAQLAVGSGEGLEDSVDETDALEEHAELGEQTRTFIAVFFIVALAVFVYDRWQARRSAETASTNSDRIAALFLVLTVLAGTLSTVWIVRTGHQGAEITWEDVGKP